MTYQIDQSGKIEQTEKHTVLAAVNGGIQAVILPAKEKRRLQEFFRKEGKPQLFVDITFAAVLYLLIKKLGNPGSLIKVDTEYPGHTKVIEAMIKNLSGGDVNMSWVCLGKNSKAHDAAYKIFKGKLKTGERITAKTVEKMSKKTAGGDLKIGLSPTNRSSAPAYVKVVTRKRKKVK